MKFKELFVIGAVLFMTVMCHFVYAADKTIDVDDGYDLAYKKGSRCYINKDREMLIMKDHGNPKIGVTYEGFVIDKDGSALYYIKKVKHADIVWCNHIVSN